MRLNKSNCAGRTYLLFETTESIKTVRNRKIPFPALTLCSTQSNTGKPDEPRKLFMHKSSNCELLVRRHGRSERVPCTGEENGLPLVQERKLAVPEHGHCRTLQVTDQNLSTHVMGLSLVFIMHGNTSELDQVSECVSE